MHEDEQRKDLLSPELELALALYSQYKVAPVKDRIGIAAEIFYSLKRWNPIDLQAQKTDEIIQQGRRSQEASIKAAVEAKPEQRNQQTFNFTDFQTVLLMSELTRIMKGSDEGIDEVVSGWIKRLDLGQFSEPKLKEVTSWLIEKIKQKQVIFLDSSQIESAGGKVEDFSYISWMRGKGKEMPGVLLVFPEAADLNYGPNDFIISLNHEASHDRLEQVLPNSDLVLHEFFAFMEQLWLYQDLPENEQKSMKKIREMLSNTKETLQKIFKISEPKKLDQLTELLTSLFYGYLHGGGQKLKRPQN